MNSELAQIFKQHSVKKLRSMMELIEKFSAGLSDEQIWHRERPDANSVGNLLMHLEGNIGQFIGHCLEGKPDVRQRPLEFSTLGCIDKAALLGALGARVEQSCLFIAQIDDGLLLRTAKTINGEMTGLDVIYQVVGHFQQHTGQIVFAAKGAL